MVLPCSPYAVVRTGVKSSGCARMQVQARELRY